MKSNKAMITGVSQETYCRHGFHEWLEFEKGSNSSNVGKPNKYLKCKHCGRWKENTELKSV